MKAQQRKLGITPAGRQGNLGTRKYETVNMLQVRKHGNAEHVVNQKYSGPKMWEICVCMRHGNAGS